MRIFFLIFFALLPILGCKKRESSDTLRYLNISFKNETRSLDPRFGIDFPSVFAIKMLFEGLMYLDLDGKIKPSVAKSYTLSKDQKVYTFYLRQTSWTNGDPVTAFDFEYSWKSVVDPKTRTIGSYNFYPIKNVRAIVTGKMPIESMGVHALDNWTLRVELEHPTPYFLEMLASGTFMPVNSRIDRERPNWAHDGLAPFVCNGPFILEKNQIGNEIVVKKNPTYWRAEEVKLPGIRIAIVREPMTHLQLFEKGELDWAGKPVARMPLEAIDDLKKKGLVSFAPCLGVYWLFVNTQTIPFNNKKIRQAFAYAINREALTQHVLREEEMPATGLLPYTLSQQPNPYFEDDQGAKARALFDEALSEMGLTREDLPEITVNVSNEPIHIKTAEAIQQQWAKTLGVQVHIEHQDWKSHYGKLQSGDFQIGGMGWTSWLRDPIYILQTFRYKEDGVNMSRWEDPRYQQLLSASEEQIDPIKRKECFHLAEALLMEEMPVIPLYFTTISYMKNEQLEDVYVSELNEIDFRWAHFK